MKKAFVISITTLVLLNSCKNSSSYLPKGLRNLSDSEVIERALVKNLITESTVFKDTLGNKIQREDLEKLDQEDFYGDQYVNDRNEIVEIVVRKATAHDKEVIEKIKSAFEEGEPINVVDIDC